MTWIALALDPDPDQARELLERELDKAEYQPTLVERLQDWINSLFTEVEKAARGVAGVNPWVALLMALVLAGLVVLVLTRLQRSSAAPPPAAEVFGQGRLGAAEHRALAARALEEERWSDALVESVRALASGLIERRVLPDEPGTTAREIADRAGAVFPGEREGIDVAARHFEETLYGDRPAGEAQARAAVDLERRVREATPSTPRTGPVSAVPR